MNEIDQFFASFLDVVVMLFLHLIPVLPFILLVTLIVSYFSWKKTREVPKVVSKKFLPTFLIWFGLCVVVAALILLNLALRVGFH